MMKTVLVIVALVVIVFAFFYDVLLGPNLFLDTNPRIFDPWQAYVSDDSPARKTYFYDSFLTYLPRRVLLSESIRSGKLPLWNPYVFGGTPFLADPQTRVLYPIELLLVLQNPERAMGYDIAIHVFLAMLGMYLFLRAVGVPRSGSFLGGCTYAFSSFFYYRYGFPTLAASAAWIPFFFYGFEVAWRSARKGTLLLAGFFATGYLAGFPQIFLFGVGGVVFYGFYIAVHSPGGQRISAVLRAVKILGIAGILSLLLVSVQLLPFAEFYRNSLGYHYPSEYVLTVFVAPPVTLLRSVFSGLFGNPLDGTDWSDLPRELVHPYKPEFVVYCGAGALTLAIISVLTVRKSPRVRAFLTLLVFSIGMAVSAGLLRIGYALLPVFRASRADRVSVLACFALSAMAGIGFSLVARKQTRFRRYLIAILMGVVGFAFVSTIGFEFVGETVISSLAEKVKAMPREHWAESFTSMWSYKIKAWAEQDPAEWMDYERGQLRRGMLTVILSSAFLFIWISLRQDRRNLRRIAGTVVVLLIIGDVALTARAYYVSQTPDSISETEGIARLAYALGEPGRWRTRTLGRTADEMPAFPCNANIIFDVYSVDGQSTVRPKSYTLLKRRRDSVEEPIEIPLNARRWLAGELDDLMGVRFLLARRGDRRFEPTPVFNAITLGADSPDRLGTLSVGDESRLALCQSVGESFSFDISLPPSGILDFAVGFDATNDFDSTGERAADSVFFKLKCRGRSDTVRYVGGFDKYEDRGKWHKASVDLSPLGGKSVGITTSVICSRAAPKGSIKAGWSRFEFPIRECEIVSTAGGYEIAIGRRGRALSLVVRSEAREVPLEIQFDGDTAIRRWITFLPEANSRWITIDLKNRKGTRILLTSDSTFAIEECKQVWRGWAKDLDCRLIHDTDMCVYENRGAIERGICIDRTSSVDNGSAESSILTLQTPESLDDARCGTCDIVSYEPEDVVFDVSADRDCYVILQDTYYPGWKAYVDGVETEIHMTHLGVRAIEVPRGDHNVVMVFRPLSFKLGLMLTCLGLVLTITYAIKTRGM